MERGRSATLLAFAGLIGFGIAWGATVPLTRVAVSTGHLPMGLIVWQFVFGLFFLGAILLHQRIRVPFSPGHLRYYLIIALIGTLVPNSFSFLAAAQLPAGIMALAIATVPMFSLMIALGLRTERFRPKRVLGVILGVTAMMLIALPEASLPSPAMVPWVAVALIAPLCYGFEGNYVSLRAPRDAHPIAVLWGASALGLFIAVPAALISGQWVDLFRPWQAPEWAMLGSALGHAIAYAGYMWLVGFAGVVFTAQIAYVVTVAAIAISILFLGETYSAWVWMSVAMMMAALALVQPAGRLPDVGEAAAGQ